MLRRLVILGVAGIVPLASCTNREPAGESSTAFLGARILDGTGAAPIEDGVLVVRDGRIVAVGPREEVDVPAGAERIDVSGKTVMPGLINAHGHVGATVADDSGATLTAALLAELALYARYGVTTVNSLGGEGEEAIELRNGQDDATLDRARLLVAGTVVTGETPEAAVQVVDENARLGVDYIKIRVDDNLGTTTKMPPEIYRAVIARAHEHGLPVAAHVYYLEDAKALLRAGVDLIGHSVRDRAVDEELVRLLRERDVCYVPTLTREVSTFVYESRPAFFDDPFFLREADSSVIRQLSEPSYQRGIAESASAQQYEAGLVVASRNLRTLAAGGVRIALGTDTGPFGRFPGFFEHLELELMAQAGLTAQEILWAATGGAASCLGLDAVGTLEVGKWADFLVLLESPLDDITNSRTIESVWIAGNRVPGR